MRARLRRSSFQHGQNGSARKGKKKPSAQQKARHLMVSLIAAGEKKAATSILAKVRKFALRRPGCKAKNLEELATHVRDFATRFRTSGGRPNRFVKIAVRSVLCELDIAIRCVTARCVKTKPLPPLKTCGTGDRGGVSLPPDPCIESIERLAYETEVFRSTFSHYVRCCESHGFIRHGSKDLKRITPDDITRRAVALHQAINIIINVAGNINLDVDVTPKEDGGQRISIVSHGGGGDDDDDDPPNTKRGKGVSEFSGILPNSKESIFVSGGDFLKVGKEKYFFEGAAQWNIINRFLRSINDCDNNSEGNFPVTFTTRDYNKCKGDCRALIKKFIERQPAANPIRNHQFEERARFRVELL